MSLRQLILNFLLIALGVSSVGCRYRDPSLELLEGENRWLEEQLYEMENHLEQACVDLSRCKEDYDQEVAQFERKLKNATPTPATLDPIPNGSSNLGADDFTVINDSSPPTSVIFPDGTVIPDSQPGIIIEPSDSSYVLPGQLSGELPVELPIEMPVDLPGGLPVDATDTSPVIVSEDDTNSVPTINEDNQLPAPIREPDLEPTPAAPDFGSDPAPTPAGREPELETSPAPPNKLDNNLDDSDGLFDSPIDSPTNLDPGDDAALPPLEPQKYSIRLQSHVSTEPVLAPKPALDAHITHIVAKARRTKRGVNAHKHDLQIIVQPRNADGSYVALPANVSVVVIDDELEGHAGRIARWDLDANEVSRQFRQTEDDAGIFLEFDWPNLPPNSDKLHLYVRYTTIDGRKLQAHKFLEPIAEAADDEGWNVIGKSQRSDEWQILSIEDADSSNAVKTASTPNTTELKEPAKFKPPPPAVKPSVAPAVGASDTNQRYDNVKPAAWQTVPITEISGARPSEPRRMPNVKAAPIPKPISKKFNDIQPIGNDFQTGR